MAADKRERGQNWTYEEKLYLFNTIQERIDAIECKNVDNDSLKLKQEAWKEVYDEFCQRYGPFRELQRVREQWRRMKTGAKNEYREYEKAKQKGDGSESRKIPSKVSEMVHDLIPHEFNTQSLLFSEQTSYPSMIGIHSRVDGLHRGGALDQGGTGSSSNPTTPVMISKNAEDDCFFVKDETEDYQEVQEHADENGMELEEPNISMTSTAVITHPSPTATSCALTPINPRAHRATPRSTTPWQIIPPSGSSSGADRAPQNVEQEIAKLRLKEQKRKLEMMEEVHVAKMKVIRLEKQKDQLPNSSNPDGGRSVHNLPTQSMNTTDRYRHMWQRQNHHDTGVNLDKEILRMKREEHRRTMEVLEEQHAAKMAVLEMEKDLVSMKIEAFIKEMRKEEVQEAGLNQDQNSDHGNQSDTDGTT